MYGLDQSATVYTPHATTGDYTVTAKTGLACRLAFAASNRPGDLGERADVGERRRLLWAETYTMPEAARVTIGGKNYNVIPGTVGAIRGPAGAVTYYRCDVEAAL